MKGAKWLVLLELYKSFNHINHINHPGAVCIKHQRSGALARSQSLLLLMTDRSHALMKNSNRPLVEVSYKSYKALMTYLCEKKPCENRFAPPEHKDKVQASRKREKMWKEYSHLQY